MGIMERKILFDTAELALKKGFTVPCRDGFLEEEFVESWDLHLSDHYEERLKSQKGFGAPTQSKLQTWLREFHKIEVVSVRYMPSIYHWSIEDDNTGNEYFSDDSFKTYEEALEEGLKEALNLLPDVK